MLWNVDYISIFFKSGGKIRKGNSQGVDMKKKLKPEWAALANGKAGL